MKPLSVVVVVALTVASGAVLLYVSNGPECAEDAKCDADATQAAAPGFSVIRILTKQLLADEVLERRRPLTEAAALFRVLDAMPPTFTVRVEFDGPPGVVEGSDEHMCRHVIRYARTRSDPRYGGDPTREPDVARLEEELRARITGPGLRLPDPADLPPLDGLLARAWSRDQSKLGWAESLASATRPTQETEHEKRK